jgi:hypothetical protein
MWITSEKQDPHELANAIVRLLMDKRLRDELAAICRASYSDVYVGNISEPIQGTI